MRRAGGDRGQATVEWVGLLLGVGLMFGALVAGGRGAAKGESARELGDALAERITCAARDACRAAPARPRPRAVRPSTPREERPPERVGSDGLPLRGVKGFAKRTWLLCLGYRRWQYERSHPLSPRQALPPRDTLKMVNECANPLSFLFD
jgi:hypothetical protein